MPRFSTIFTILGWLLLILAIVTAASSIWHLSNSPSASAPDKFTYLFWVVVSTIFGSVQEIALAVMMFFFARLSGKNNGDIVEKTVSTLRNMGDKTNV